VNEVILASFGRSMLRPYANVVRTNFSSMFALHLQPSRLALLEIRMGFLL
jgi:hypothetical protein